jgi:hypothetical protein
MGLLDDAIREHLELKRRHGADPSEVERQEQEALGPARRGAAPSAEADAELDTGAVSVGMLDEDDEADTPSAPYDDDDVDEPADEPAPSMPAGEPEAPVGPPAPAPAPEERADVTPEAEIVEDPAPAAAEPEPEPERGPADEAASAEEPAAGEDVLEETPEFLQETPEHDRLWFEQKPPRDFEF